MRKLLSLCCSLPLPLLPWLMEMFSQLTWLGNPPRCFSNLCVVAHWAFIVIVVVVVVTRLNNDVKVITIMIIMFDNDA